MNPEQDQFRNVRRLLALKRHEQPPPGYFDDFSEQVIIRIRAGERIEHFSLWEALSWEAPWLQRIWSILETRPVAAGAFGAAICGLLMAGTLYSEPKEGSLMPLGDSLATVPPPQHHQIELRASGSESGGLLTEGVAATAAPAPISTFQGISPGQQNDSLFQQFKNSQQPRVDLINSSAPR